MSVPKRTAWAVVENGVLDIDTVYGTRRGALVSWLARNGVTMLAQSTDEAVERAWGHHVDGYDSGGLICTTVTIEVTKR